jgi:hypothetical protein
MSWFNPKTKLNNKNDVCILEMQPKEERYSMCPGMHLESTNAGQILEIQIESLNAICIGRSAGCSNNSGVKLKCSYGYAVSKFMGSPSYFSYTCLVIYLLVYIFEGYIICLIINYISIANYTVHNPNMIGYCRTISLWLN